MADTVRVFRMSGDYHAARRAVRNAERVYCETAWGRLRVSKERMLEGMKASKTSHAGRIYRWRYTDTGAVWCDEWSSKGFAWRLCLDVDRETDGE